MNSTEVPARLRPPGPSLRVAIVLMIAGVALAVPTGVAGIVPIVRAVTAPAGFEAPGSEQLHLGQGSYMLYEDAGATSIGSAFSSPAAPTITPDEVTVTGPDNNAVAVLGPPTLEESRVSAGQRFIGSVRFTTPAAGEYTVKVDNVEPKEVLVARPLADTITASLGWFGLMGLGGLVFLVGLVLLIAGSVRRGRAQRAFAYPTAIPPGWHPDPSGSGRLRYWDGQQWTEHVQ